MNHEISLPLSWMNGKENIVDSSLIRQRPLFLILLLRPFSSCKSNQLHREVVVELIRKGVDQCNAAILRIVHENRENGKMFRPDTIEPLDLRVEGLSLSVYDIDNKVKELRKEIRNLLDGASMADEDVVFASVGGTIPIQSRKRSNAFEREWNPHHYASRKKTSARRQSSTMYDDDNTHPASSRGSSGRSTSKRKRSSLSSYQPARKKNKTTDGSNRRISDAFDNVGETPDSDVEVQHRTSASTKSRPAPTTKHSTTDEFRVAFGEEQGRSLASTSSTVNARNRNKSRQRQDGTQRCTQGSRIVNVGSGSGHERQPFASQRDVEFVEDEIVTTAPPLPEFLSLESLFSSISLAQPSDVGTTPSTPSGDTINVTQVCQSLAVNYPSSLKLCQRSVHHLSTMISTRADIEYKEVVAILDTLLGVFRCRCSTLLDLFRSRPKDFCFQLDCWSLIYSMMKKKLHAKLTEQDDIIFKLFGRTTPLAHHIILQLIDLMYSQFLWEEWGETPRLDKRANASLCRLRNCIGGVIPDLALTVSELLRTKVGCQSWYRSKVNEQNKTDFSEMYFVSSINPETHVQFIASGTVADSLSGRELCLLLVSLLSI